VEADAAAVFLCGKSN